MINQLEDEKKQLEEQVKSRESHSLFSVVQTSIQINMVLKLHHKSHSWLIDLCAEHKYLKKPIQYHTLISLQ